MSGTTHQRPWTARYTDRMPLEVEPEAPSGPAMFEATLARDPEGVLVRYVDHPITTAEVDAASSALAVGLLEGGIAPGDRVALYLQNVPEFVVGLLAIWKAGAIGVLCNPMLKERELRKQLDDSGATGLLCLTELHRDVAAAVVPETAVRLVVTTDGLAHLPADADRPGPLAEIERDDPAAPPEGTTSYAALLERHAGQAPSPADLGPDDVAFLTYTSGTTGPSKGAMNLHRNLVAVSQTWRDCCATDPGDGNLGVAPLFHITGVVAHLGLTLLQGGPLLLAGRFDPALTAELVERHRPRFVVAAITVFTALMGDEDAAARDLSSLTKCWSGGAPIAPTIAERWERLTGQYLHNVYGMTETTSGITYTPAGDRAPVDDDSGALSVGVPGPGVDVRIVGEDGEDLPHGEAGELLMRGPGVVPAYWENPEESEVTMGDGWLRSGDVAVQDAAGWVYLVDRRKDMIVASGYKVWPREVEDVLVEHDAVAEAAVVGVADEYRGESVKAFVALRGGASVEPDELVAHCKARMAAYKYPREVVLLEALPKTATGKILRRELRDG